MAFLRPRIGGGRAIAPQALMALSQYLWPGNVRELINVIERAMLLCTSDEITLTDLPESIGGTVSASVQQPHATSDLLTLPADVNKTLVEMPWRNARRIFLNRLEREYLRQLLESTKGHIGRTAKLAGMQPRSLFDKMKKHGLCKEDFRK